MSGEPESLNGKVKIYSGKLDNIRVVVNLLSRPGSMVSSVSDTNLDLLLVHSESLVGSVTYFGTEEQILEVKRKISREGGTVSENIVDQNKLGESEGVETESDGVEKDESTTPINEARGWARDNILVETKTPVRKETRMMERTKAALMKEIR